MDLADARRVGWLGGSFDPVHDGHLAAARAAREQLALDLVLLVPAAAPPHKRGRTLAPGADRLALLHRASAGESWLVPDDCELRRGGVSFSVDTARELRARLHPDAELFAIVGADTLADLPTWRALDEICALATFCAVTRPGTPLDPTALLPCLDAAVVERIREHRIEMTPVDSSSTEIRAALARGARPRGLPDAVLEEIRARGLYESDGGSGASSIDRSGTGWKKP